VVSRCSRPLTCPDGQHDRSRLAAFGEPFGSQADIQKGVDKAGQGQVGGTDPGPDPWAVQDALVQRPSR